jgi:hypothetical protein
MLGKFTEVISRLEQQRAAIDKAIEALREFEDGGIAEQPRPKKTVTEKPAKKKRKMSEEGRQRIIEASRKRWAAVRKAAKKETKKSA